MSATNSLPYDGIVHRLGERLEEWRRKRAERRELEEIGCEDAHRLLADCGVTIDDLDRATNPKSIELLPKMMDVVGVPDDLGASACRRDLERTCAVCGEWRRCEAALAVGTAVDTWKEFCGNAPTLGSLADHASGAKHEKD